MLTRLIDPKKAMDRGRGRHRTTKSQRGKWVVIDSNIKFVDTIKVTRQSNRNRMRKVFMNSQMLQRIADKVLKTRLFFFNSKT